MEAIAAEAGVSKVTAYRYFPDKAALFEATVLEEMQRIEAAQTIEPPGAPDAPGESASVDLATRLNAFGIGIMQFLAGRNAVAFYANLAGELSRHPDLARRFWLAGPGRTRDNLARLLADAVARDEIILDDPEIAAEQLFGLWQGFTNFQHALGIASASDSETRVRGAVEVFLRAYAAPIASPIDTRPTPRTGPGPEKDVTS